MERLCRQYHLEQDDELPTHIPKEFAQLTEFVLVTPCALHDSQNAFRWGLMEGCSDKQLMRDTYVCIESLRNSSDLLAKHIGHWVALRLRPQAHKGSKWVEQQRCLWEALGLEAHAAESMVELQLEFVGGFLHVWADAPAGGDLVGYVCGGANGRLENGSFHNI